MVNKFLVWPAGLGVIAQVLIVVGL